MATRARSEATLAGIERLAGSATGEQELLTGVAALVRRAVPYVGAAWLSTDPATTLFTDGVVEDFLPETCHPWFHNELVADDVHKFRRIAGRGPARLSEVEDRSVSARWREIMRPQGLDDELRLTLDDTTGTWGTVELHREVGDPDFDRGDAALLASIGPTVAAGLRRVAVARRAATSVEPDGPGVVLVHADGSAEPMTHAGAGWLEVLMPPSAGQDQRTSLLTVAGLAAAEGDRAGGARRLRSRTRDGAWVTLHPQPTIRGDDVAVIIEPIRPAEIAELLSLAHGLTPREQQVVLLLARGRSTSDIAAELVVSRHTVRDHVKASLAKVGVNSRSELLAVLFDRHYVGPLLDVPGASAHAPSG
jgi:DNA-binding CsgD family transcriptional regulator